MYREFLLFKQTYYEDARHFIFKWNFRGMLLFGTTLQFIVTVFFYIIKLWSFKITVNYNFLDRSPRFFLESLQQSPSIKNFFER